MEIKITSCNNIDYGVIQIQDKRLNIKHAINGTGKSTIARAIVNAADDAKTGGKSLLSMIPFKNKGTDGSSNSVVGCEAIKTIKIFDERYVNDIAFQPDELIKGSFEVFVRGEAYEAGIKDIEQLVAAMKNTLTEDAEITELIRDFDEIIKAFGAPVKTGIHGSSAMSQAFKGGNNVLNIPEGLERYKSFIQHNENYKWMKWQNDGSAFSEIADDCPFCTNDTKQHKDIIKKVAEVYKPKAIENLNKIVTTFKSLEKYFSDDTRQRIDSFVTKVGGYTDDESSYLVEVKDQIERLKGKFSTIRYLGFGAFRDVEKVLELLSQLKIDLALYPHLISDATKSKVEIVNSEIYNLNETAGKLQGSVAKQKKLIEKIVEENGEAINNFLKNAGYRYHVKIVEEKDEYRLKLEHDDIKGEITDVRLRLSFGERNAFALVLFMFDALKSQPDLIILDDPISSFDKNKKYAVMEMLFNKSNLSLSQKTVLMLTHDFEPIVDLVHHHSDRFNTPYASFLENKNGQLIEIAIEKEDIKTFVDINTHNLSQKIHALNKLVYLRRYYEVTDRKDHTFDVLSSIFHKRDVPQCRDAELWREMSKEEIEKGTEGIKSRIPEFDYDTLLKLTRNDAEMRKIYESTESNYEKLHIYRIIFDGKPEQINSKVITKFINQAFHIENDYIYQLNPRKYQMVPEYVINECNAAIQALN